MQLESWHCCPGRSPSETVTDRASRRKGRNTARSSFRGDIGISSLSFGLRAYPCLDEGEDRTAPPADRVRQSRLSEAIVGSESIVEPPFVPSPGEANSRSLQPKPTASVSSYQSFPDNWTDRERRLRLQEASRFVNGARDENERRCFTGILFIYTSSGSVSLR